MKVTARWLLVALATGGTLVAVQAQAQQSPATRGDRPAAMPRSSAAPAGNSARVDHGGRHRDRGWSGTGRWAGHPHGHWGGYRHWAPRWSFYFGVPVLWGSSYWGAPYWYDSYPGRTVIYREVERDGPFQEHRIGPATTEVPRGEGEGGPVQGPLYMNYCESAKAYFPKVTTCPEGWKFVKPTE